MSWDDICASEDYQGQWVALDACSYDEDTGEAKEGLVVDADADLVELCERLREAERKNCAILFAEAHP
jgi:hypothetical protein